MDTFRRRSHRTVSEHRIDRLEELVADILLEYRADIGVHDCSSCMVNVEIFERRAREMNVDLVRAPF